MQYDCASASRLSLMHWWSACSYFVSKGIKTTMTSLAIIICHIELRGMSGSTQRHYQCMYQDICS